MFVFNNGCVLHVIVSMVAQWSSVFTLKFHIKEATNPRLWDRRTLPVYNIYDTMSVGNSASLVMTLNYSGVLSSKAQWP